jgi:hypothetical protein
MDMHCDLGLEKEVPALHGMSLLALFSGASQNTSQRFDSGSPCPVRRTPVVTPNSGTKFRPRVTHFAFLFRTDSSPNVGTPSTIANLARHSR